MVEAYEEDDGWGDQEMDDGGDDGWGECEPQEEGENMELDNINDWGR